MSEESIQGPCSAVRLPGEDAVGKTGSGRIGSERMLLLSGEAEIACGKNSDKIRRAGGAANDRDKE